MYQLSLNEKRNFSFARQKGNNIALRAIVPAPYMQQLNQVYVPIIIEWEEKFFAHSPKWK